MTWTQPLCNDCWDTLFPDRLSPRADRGDEETCSRCGETTVSGIYYRADPKTVPHPRTEEHA